MAENRIDILIAARNATGPGVAAANRDLASLGATAQRALSTIDSAANALSGGLAGIGAAAFGIGSLVGVLQQVGSEMAELGRRGAVVGQLADVFDDYAASVGTSSDAVLDAMKKASSGTIAESELILNANKAIQFQVAQTPAALAKLVELSSALGRAQGISDQDALGFLTTGIARESKLILDNLGLIVDVEGATAAYAATLGKTADDLSQVERKQAILNEAYRQGEVALKANREAAESPATRIERFDAAKQDLSEQAGLLLANVASDSIGRAADDLQSFREQAFEGGKSLDTLNKELAHFIELRDSMAKGGRIPDEVMGLSLQLEISPADAANQFVTDTRQKILSLIESQPKISIANPEDFFAGSSAKVSFGKNILGEALALEGIPPIIDEVVKGLEGFATDSPLVLAKNITGLKDAFDDLDKIQGSVASSINNNAVKLSDVIGDDRALAIATQQLDEFDAKLKELTSQALTGEIDPGEFLFKLQTLPSQATEIFGQVQSAAKDGGEKLRSELANLVNLEDVFRSGGNTAGADVLAGQIEQLQGILDLVAPAASGAAAGIGGLGADTGNAASEVSALVNVLAGAPPALAAAGSAMIAAGVDASTAAAMVAGLRSEFALLEGAQAGARRAIITRAAGVANIVGDKKALELANQQIASLDGSIAGLQQQVIAGTLSETELEFATARLGDTTTSTFDEIEEADRKAQQLARGGLASASKAANEAEKSFDSLKGKVAGVLSGALNLDVGVDTEKILGREDAINEDARRLADVAVKGFDSPWAEYLKDKFPDTIGAAFDGADPKRAAAQLLRDFEDGLRPELLDKEAAKERVRRALIGDANLAALAGEIAGELNAELGGKISLGQIQATAGATLGVDGAEADQVAATLTAATGNIQEKLGGLGGSLKTGLLAALEGVGAAVAASIDKQFRAESNLKLVEGAGYLNGVAWGKGFLTSMDQLSAQTLEKLAGLVVPYVDAAQQRTATLQGAN